MTTIRLNGTLPVPRRISGGTMGSYYEKIRFVFSEEWSGLACKAVFTSARGDEVTLILGDEELENGVRIPWEVTQYSGDATFRVSGYTIDENGKIDVKIISKVGTIDVDATHRDTCPIPLPPTPDAYEQLRYQMQRDIGEAITEELGTGKYNGPQGDPGKAATIEVGEVMSLPYGYSPIIANAGTETNAVFRFGIPAGKPGESPSIEVKEHSSTEGGGITVTVHNTDGTTESGRIYDGGDGPQGAPGLTPYVGENGNWWIGDEDTGIAAKQRVDDTLTQYGCAADAGEVGKVFAYHAGLLERTLQHSPMSLTDEQKAVSRENIGAASVVEATASGDDVTLTDSADAALRGLNLFGKSTQQTTTGAQLASFPDVDAVELGGLTWSCKGGVITVSGTQTGASNSDDVGVVAEIPVAAGTYSVSGDVGLVEVRVEVIHADGSVMVRFSTDTITLDGTETSVRVYCKAYATNATIDYTLYPMFNVGTSALPWERYTGGAAAPNPDYPMEISSAGDGGAVEVAVNDQTIVVSTPNGLAGVPVTSGGNYTDDSGQMWVCDEIDFARGVYVQRIWKYEITGAEEWTVSQYNPGSGNIRYDATINDSKGPVGNDALCNAFPYNGPNKDGVWVHPQQNVYLALRIRWTFATVDELTAYLTERYNVGNPVTVYYALAAPIETPLTEEQLAAYEALRTAKPTTVITNDGGAWMAVNYAADTKAYVDRENQQQALAMMDMIDASVPEIAAEAAALVEGGGASKDWRLINTVRTTEETVDILIEADSEGNPFECDEVLIVTNNLVVTAAGTNYLQLNKNNAFQSGKYNFFATTTNNSGRHLRARVMDNLGAFEISFGDAGGTIVSNSIGWAGIVSKKWVINAVQLKSTFQAGGTLYLYGR